MLFYCDMLLFQPFLFLIFFIFIFLKKLRCLSRRDFHISIFRFCCSHPHECLFLSCVSCKLAVGSRAFTGFRFDFFGTFKGGAVHFSRRSIRSGCLSVHKPLKGEPSQTMEPRTALCCHQVVTTHTATGSKRNWWDPSKGDLFSSLHLHCITMILKYQSYWK